MGKHKPIFLSGAYAVISVAGKKLAFCRGISVRIEVPHSNNKVLGMYESADMQPQSYNISGSFSVYRYIANSLGENENFISSEQSPHNVLDKKGNGVGTFYNNFFDFFIHGRANDNFNPAYLMYSTTFDIAVYQIVQDDIGLEKRLVPAFVLRQCRLIASDISVMKREISTQNFSFMANYIDEDSFISGISGSGGGW